VREEICQEAIRLMGLLVENPAGNRPEAHALLALMLLNAARIPARVDDEGNLLRLQEQDRSRWDKALIARGMFHFAQSAAGDALTEYHLQASIAACHCTAKDYESTDWPHILSLYDLLIKLDNSPVVALNRAIVIANISGPQAGLDAISAIDGLDKLESYYLLYAALGDFEERLNHREAAAGHFRKAMELAELKSEKAFLEKRIKRCEEVDPARAGR
jgi:predicted RNA polymerase sigma factor